jgi:outer membrane protein TolC
MQEEIFNMALIPGENSSKKYRFFYKLFLCISIYFILSPWVSASSQPDSLYQYLEIAAKNNPGVLQKFSEYKAAQQKVPQVGSLPDPELSIGVFLKPMELIEGKQVSDIRLMQMFPWFGVLKNAKDEMSLMAKAKFELFRNAKLSLFYEVQRTWYELIKVQQNIQTSKKNIEILRSIERLTLVRFKSPISGGGSSDRGLILNSTSQSSSYGSSGMQTMGGDALSSTGTISSQGSSSMSGNTMGSQTGGSGLVDLYRIQIEASDLENNIASLKNLHCTISARFNSYLNRPLKTFISLPDTLKPEILNLSMSAVTDSMLAKNPMLNMLKFEQQSLEARYRMVTDMGYPMVGLGVNYSLINKSEMSTSQMNGKDMIMPMVTITLPIYRKKYNAMKSETELLKTATSQGYLATSNSLQAEFYEAVQLYQDATRRQKLYADQFQLANKSLSIMLKSFSSSGTGLTDLLRVRQQTLDYEFKQIEAIADCNTAIAWLKRLGNLEIYGNK